MSWQPGGLPVQPKLDDQVLASDLLSSAAVNRDKREKKRAPNLISGGLARELSIFRPGEAIKPSLQACQRASQGWPSGFNR